MKPTHIILHHSLTKDNQTVSWQAIRKYHVEINKWKDIGYHFGIELVNSEYEIIAGRMLLDIGAHTIGMNDSSIGICIIGNYDINDLPKEAEKKLIILIKTLMVIFNISVTNIKKHSDYAKYKTCPGLKFPFNRIIKALT